MSYCPLTCFPPSLPFPPSLTPRYEVAPRSDSEESGSEFEEEVSDLTVILVNGLSWWGIFDPTPCAAVMQILLNAIQRCLCQPDSIHTLCLHLCAGKVQQGAAAVCVVVRICSVSIKASVVFFLLSINVSNLSLKEEEEAAKAEMEEKIIDPNGDVVCVTAAKHIIEYCITSHCPPLLINVPGIS